MKAIDYLSRIEPVVMAFFSALQEAGRRRDDEYRYLEPKFRFHRFQSEHWSQVEEFDDLRAQYAHSRAGAAHQALLLIDCASAAAAGSVLQVAKLCVSMAWPVDQRLTKGRVVGTQPLAAVIWHARNQALHFEEGIPKNSYTRASLELLHAECGLNIDELNDTPRSLARDVLEILGWNDYEAFARDMVALLSTP